MGTLIALTTLAVAAFLIMGTLAVIGLVLKALFWMLFFPIRFVFKLVFWVLGAGIAVLLLPLILLFAAIAVIGGIVVALFSLLAPLLPVALVAMVGWAIYRGSTRRPSPVI